MVVKLLIKETSGNLVVQRVQCGKVRLKLGQKTKRVSSSEFSRGQCVQRVTAKERDVVRDMKEKEREWRALLSCVGSLVSFDFLK